MSLPTCLVLKLGLTPYESAWKLQDYLAAQIAAGTHPPTLLLLEHPHTFTFGRRGQAKNLLWDEVELIRRGIRVHWVDRGGDVTYHGPGQLVGYPLIPLSTSGLKIDPSGDSAHLPQADYIGYVRKLEEVLIRVLERMQVPAMRIEGLTGVWVNLSRSQSTERTQPAKIAAIGVKVDARGVTRHGFALNVNPDMSYWQGIIGCGLEDSAVTCLADLLLVVPSLNQVSEAVIQSFAEVFGYQLSFPE